MPKISKVAAPPAEPTTEDQAPEDYEALDAAMVFEEDTTPEEPAQAESEPDTQAEESSEETTESPTEYAETTREERLEQLKAATVAELREIAEGDYDISPKGTKPALIKRIITHEYPGETADTTPKPRERVKTAPRAVVPTSRSTSLLFTPLTDVKEFSRVLYYGKEGSAKTTNLLALANLGKMLLINAEGGVKKRALTAQGINLDNVAVWPPEGQEITYQSLRDVYFQIKSDLEDDPNSWIGVGFDSVTDIVQGILDQVSTHRVDKVRNRGIDVDLIDSFFVDRDDYGTMSKMMRRLMRDFRDLPLHVVYTALERRDVDEDTGQVAYGPAMSPAVGVDLMGYVDLVLYCRAADEEQDVFRAVSKKAGKYRVKDRDGVLPRVLVKPTMPRILGYIDGTLTEDTDEEQTKLRTAEPKPTTGKKTSRRTTKTETKKEETENA